MSNIGNFTTLVMVSSFLGICFGGLIGKLIFTWFKGNVYYVYSCCGGMLVGLLLLELIPHSLHNYRAFGIIVGIAIGYALMMVIEAFLHSNHHSKQKLSTPIFLLIALIFHTIPVGLNLGINAANDNFPTSSFLTAFILHQVPEGVALIASFAAIKMNEISFGFMVVLLVLILGASVLIGKELRIESLKFNTLLTGGAIGSFSYVTINEFLWKSTQELKRHHFILAVLTGFGLIKLYLFLS